MSGRMQEIQTRLRGLRVSGSSGGGMVQVEANGLGEILSLSIDPTLIQGQEQDMIEDLIPSAVNQALAKAKEGHAEAMKDLTAGMELSGLSVMIAKVTGTSPTNE